jgi:hypothetical protein
VPRSNNFARRSRLHAVYRVANRRQSRCSGGRVHSEEDQVRVRTIATLAWILHVQHWRINGFYVDRGASHSAARMYVRGFTTRLRVQSCCLVSSRGLCILSRSPQCTSSRYHESKRLYYEASRRRCTGCR